MGTKDIAPAGTGALFEKISALIEESRKKVATAVNVAEVYIKYEIGRYIVEDEQEGNAALRTERRCWKHFLKDLPISLAKAGQLRS